MPLLRMVGQPSNLNGLRRACGISSKIRQIYALVKNAVSLAFDNRSAAETSNALASLSMLRGVTFRAPRSMLAIG